MTKAVWKGTTLAQSSDCVTVEGNLYFPPDSVRRELFQSSSKTTFCSWKGLAHYYDVVVDGESNDGAAWYYPEPKEAAQEIQNHVAFWRGVEILEE